MTTPLPKTASAQKHKKQNFWQIILPFSIILLLTIIGGVLIVRSGQGQASLLADISLIWLLLPLLCLGIVPIALLALMIYGMANLHRKTPFLSRRILIFFNRLSTKTRQVSNTLVSPILWSEGIKASIAAFFKRNKRS